jgi:hypothetical protein
MSIKRRRFKQPQSLEGRLISEVKRLRNIAETLPPEWLKPLGLKVATLDAQIRLGCLNTIVLLVFLLASASSAEGQTTPLPASKDTLSFQERKAEWAREDREAEKYGLSFREQKAEWARANRDAEKHGLSFREQKADWAAEWDRASREAEKQGPSFPEQKAEWDRQSREAEKHGPSFREWTRENKRREVESGPKKDRP